LEGLIEGMSEALCTKGQTNDLTSIQQVKDLQHWQ